MKHRYAYWAAAAILILGIFPTEYFHIYDHIHNFDKIMHLLGGFVVAWIVSFGFKKEGRSMSYLQFAFVLVASTALVGVLWEFAEHLSGVYLKDRLFIVYTYFHGGDLNDTLLDLTFDLAGGSLFVLGHLLTGKKLFD